MQQRLTACCLTAVVLIVSFSAWTEDEPSSGLTLGVGPEGYLSSWLVLGPLPASEIDQLPTTNPQAPLRQSPQVGDPLFGRKWTTAHAAATGVDFPARPKSAVILFAEIVADSNCRIWMSTGSNGPMNAWLNGNEILSRTLTRKHFPNTDLTALPLVAGKNDIVIVLKNLDVNRLRASVRLLNPSFGPAPVRIRLPGATDPIDVLTETKGNLKLTRTVSLEDKHICVRASLAFPGGRPILSPTAPHVALHRSDGSLAESRVMEISTFDAKEVDLGTSCFDGDPLPSEFRVSFGGAQFVRRLGFRFVDVQRLSKAQTDLSAAFAEGPVDKTTFESLAWRISHLKELIEAGDEDAMYIDKETRNTARMAESLKEGNDPYFNRNNQVQRRGYRSSLDGSLQPYVLYVPPGWKEDDDRKFGLLIALHGLNSGPMKTMQAVFGIPMVEGETKKQKERYPEPVGVAPMFVLTPFGFGNAGYRAFGERDVFDALEQVMIRYRIHPDRIYITGASMGGIGAAALPLHYPDRFAAAAPLCGYHSMFLFRGVLGRTYQAFEQFLLEARSNANWAANGKYVPMHIVHGLKDSPSQSRVLVNNYKNLGYNISYETPNLGHNVWDLTYQQRQIFSHFAPYRREAHPRQVTFHTPSLRYASSYFVQIDEVEDYGRWTKVAADWQKDNHIRIQTENAARLTIHNDDVVRADGPVTAVIDGTNMPLDDDALSWTFTHQGGSWVRADIAEGPSPTLSKHPGLSGPIEDALYDPLLFVYGTRNEAEETLSRQLIDDLINKRAGITIDWPVKADKDVTEIDLETKSIVIVGTPQGNGLLRRIEKDLPVQVEGNALRLGEKKYEGRAPAAVFIYPNPLNPDRYVTVYTGVSLEALFYVANLPDLLPDYILFDGPEMTYKNGRILDSRQILTAGFFDGKWQLPDKAAP